MCSGPESALESLWQNQTDLGFQWPHARQRDRSPRLLVLETHRRPSSQSQEHREPHPQDAGVPGTDPPTPHLGDPGGSCLSAEHGAGVEMEVSLEIGTTVSSAADPQLLLTPRNLVNEFRSIQCQQLRFIEFIQNAPGGVVSAHTPLVSATHPPNPGRRGHHEHTVR